MISELVFCVEGPAEKAMLQGLLPKVLPNHITPSFRVFEGKSDMQKRLVAQIRGTRTLGTAFVVLRDQDSGDCRTVKSSLMDLCQQAGRPDTTVRIACHELESWYLGNLQAVEQALDLPGLYKQQSKAKYRSPDQLSNPKQELKILTKQRYQEKSGSLAIGPLLDPDNNQSHSFRVFVEGVRTIASRTLSVP